MLIYVLYFGVWYDCLVGIVISNILSGWC